MLVPGNISRLHLTSDPKLYASALDLASSGNKGQGILQTTRARKCWRPVMGTWAASEIRWQVPKEYITEYLSFLKIRKKEGR